MVKMNMKILMATKEVSQRKVAEDTGIGTNTINSYVNNTFTTINKDHIDMLCKYFNCKVEELIKIE